MLRIVNLSIEGLFRKPGKSLRLLLIVTLAFACAVADLSFLGSMKTTNLEQLLDTYGEWSFCLANPTAKEADWLLEQPWLGETGRQASYSLGTLHLGTMESSFVDMGRLEMLEGRLPENSGEIAMEADMLSSLNLDYTLGQTVTVTTSVFYSGNSIEISCSYVLTGILRQYSRLWVLEGTAANALVNAVVTSEGMEYFQECAASTLQGYCERNQLSPPGSMKALLPEIDLLFCKTSDPEAAESSLQTTIKNAERRVCTNVAFAQTKQTEQWSSLFLWLISAAVLLTISCTYLLQIPQDANTLAVFHSLGATHAQALAILLVQTGIVCLPAFLLGAGLSVVLTKLLLSLVLSSGSVALQVVIPWGQVTFVALLWAGLILLLRAAVFCISLWVPLVGQFRMGFRQLRRTRFARNLTIVLMLALVNFSVLLAVFGLYSPVRTYKLLRSSPDYLISSRVASPSAPVAPEEVQQLDAVPGVHVSEAFSELGSIGVSFSGENNILTNLNVIDGSRWEKELSLGNELEAFQNGLLVLLCLPTQSEDGTAIDLGRYSLPDEDICLTAFDQTSSTYSTFSLENGLSYAEESSAQVWRLENVPVSLRFLSIPQGKSLSGFYTPYSIFCSEAFYRERILPLLPEGFQWYVQKKNYAPMVITGGAPYGYTNLYLNADFGSVGFDTDKLLSAQCSKLGLHMSNLREYNDALRQTNLQKILLVSFLSGSIALMACIVLSCLLGLENDQQLHSSRILSAIGMTPGQLRRKHLRTALCRCLGAGILGWIGYMLYTGFDGGKFLWQTVLDHYALLQFYGLMRWLPVCVTALLLFAELFVTMLPKLALLRRSYEQL